MESLLHGEARRDICDVSVRLSNNELADFECLTLQRSQIMENAYAHMDKAGGEFVMESDPFV